MLNFIKSIFLHTSQQKTLIMEPPEAIIIKNLSKIIDLINQAEDDKTKGAIRFHLLQPILESISVNRTIEKIQISL